MNPRIPAKTAFALVEIDTGFFPPFISVFVHSPPFYIYCNAFGRMHVNLTLLAMKACRAKFSLLYSIYCWFFGFRFSGNLNRTNAVRSGCSVIYYRPNTLLLASDDVTGFKPNASAYYIVDEISHHLRSIDEHSLVSRREVMRCGSYFGGVIQGKMHAYVHINAYGV